LISKKSFLFLARYFDEVSRDSGQYCFGIDETLKALEMGAVETLIVWENFDVTRYVLRNPQTQETKILHLRSDQEKEKSHFQDKETGVELEHVEEMPLLEWYANNYKNFGKIFILYLLKITFLILCLFKVQRLKLLPIKVKKVLSLFVDLVVLEAFFDTKSIYKI
jgi:hypothetical protein